VALKTSPKRTSWYQSTNFLEARFWPTWKWQ
jgi:hypothetical protein